MSENKISIRYFFAVLIAVAMTWIVHEFAHWLTNELLGYESIMSLNGVSFVEDENPTDFHRIIISASGPLITIIQALLAYWFLNTQNWNKLVYPFLFTAFYMRFLAGVMNVVNLNDEGRISAFLKIGTFTLPIIVTAILFFMVYKISKAHNLNWKFQLSTTVTVMVLSSVLILVDQFFGVRLL